MDRIVCTEKLRRRMGDRWAVEGIDLSVPEGSVYGFLGPNGAGKTTTIRLLLGLLKPTSGTIRLFDLPMPARRLEIARRVGALVETPSFYENLSARENLLITCRLAGTMLSEIDRVLALVDLTTESRRPVSGFSLGMKQRLGIARALIGEPRLVLLDEPTNGLDPQGIRDIRDLIRSLPTEAGTTVLVSSHLLAEVEQIATHVGLMHHGTLIAQGPIATLGDRTRDLLEIGVDDATAAARLLPQRDLTVTIEDTRRLTVQVRTGAADPARINRHLVENGIAVSHLALRKPSLEDIFMRLTAFGEPRP